MKNERLGVADHEIVKLSLTQSTVYNGLSEIQKGYIIHRILGLMSMLRKESGNGLNRIGFTNDGIFINGEINNKVSDLLGSLQIEIKAVLGNSFAAKQLVSGSLARAVRMQQNGVMSLDELRIRTRKASRSSAMILNGESGELHTNGGAVRTLHRSPYNTI